MHRNEVAYSRGFLIAVLGFLAASLAFNAGSSLLQPSVDFRWSDFLLERLAGFRWRIGDRDFGGTLVGREGWLFPGDESSLKDYQRITGLPTASLRAMQTELDSLGADLASRGTTLLVVIPPDKASIYPEYMPPEIPRGQSPSALDEFVLFMRSEAETAVIDFRPALIAARAQHPLYYRTDSHWNDFGAYYAYVELMRGLGSRFPDMQPSSLSDFVVQPGFPSNRDLARISGLSALLEGAPTLAPAFPTRIQTTYVRLSSVQDMWFTTNEDAELPRLLVLRDSFYFWLAPFIEPHFGQTTAVHYNRLGEGATIDTWVERTSPDVVILETTENALLQILPVLEARH